MIDQMLLELLGELCAKNFEVFLLLASLLSDLDNLFINVATEEGSSFSRVLLCFFHLFQNLAHASLLTFFDLLNLAHDIFEEILDKNLCLFVAVQPLVLLNTDHLTELVSYLGLVVFEAINLVPHGVIDLGHFAAQSNFLLRAGHLLLTDPSIDAADLSLQVGCQ